MFVRLGIIFLLLISFSSTSEECRVKYLEELEYTDIECQFYMGTAAYRNEVYSVAAAHWNFVLDSPIKYEGEESIKAMALSTITFLTYQGLGVTQDRSKAVRNWKDAAAKGDLEARKHLGFAYADDKYKKKDLIKALGWYESIFILYPKSTDVDESDLGLYQDAVESAGKLRALLSEKQNNSAMSFAKSTI